MALLDRVDPLCEATFNSRNVASAVFFFEVLRGIHRGATCTGIAYGLKTVKTLCSNFLRNWRGSTVRVRFSESVLRFTRVDENSNPQSRIDFCHRMTREPSK